MRNHFFTASLIIITLVVVSCASSTTIPTGTPRPIPEELRQALESSGPPGVIANAPGAIIGEASSAEAVTDFSTLKAGQFVQVSGTISVSDEGDGLLTDDKGKSIKIILPPPVFQEFSGKSEIYTTTGTLVEDPSINGGLVLQVGVSSPGNLPFSQGELPPFMQPRGEAPISPDRSLSLETDLTALGAYDALIAQEDTLTDYNLVNITGAQNIGWTLVFKHNSDAAGFNYTVNVDGTVERMPANVDEAIFIDRNTIAVDSTDAVTYFQENGANPEGLMLIALAADENGDAFWSILDGSVSSLNAAIIP